MITKEEILNCISEEDLIRYLVPEFDPQYRKNYKSIFSDKDDNPSLSFYISGNKWNFKSHNTGHQGDVFQLWAYSLGVDSKNEFGVVINHINNVCNLGLNGASSDTIKPKFIAEYMIYSDLFINYWNQFGVTKKTLEKYNIKQLARIQFESKDQRQLDFNYQMQKKIAVAYLSKGRIKTYIPKIERGFNGSAEFKGQEKAFGYKNQKGSDYFGINQLPKDHIKYIIIAAGEKDCLALNAHGFYAISLQSENQLPSTDLIKMLREKCDFLLSCYDNDKAGWLNAEKLEKIFGIKPIQIPEKINDVAIFFQTKSEKDFTLLLENAIHGKIREVDERKQSQTGKTIFHQAEEYLNAKYQFRFNKIKNTYECSLIDDFEYKELNENNLFVELQKSGIKISQNNLVALLKSDDFCINYNPIDFYFKSLGDWNDDDPDYIQQLADHVTAKEQIEFNVHLKKWLVRSIKCSLDDGYYNKHALILVHSEQNSGKSSFCRFLCPPSLKDYISENIEPGNKDSLIALSGNFIINLDELKQFSNADINVLKSWISQDKVNVRLPYEKRAKTIQRVCSFVGSTNEGEFLKDHTGSVRWLCFNIIKIDHDYNNYLTNVQKVDIDDVWAQAYSLYKSDFKSELTALEIRQNEYRNQQFKLLTPEMELIPEFCVPSNENEGEFMTATDVLIYISQWRVVKINKINIGRALSFYDHKKVMHSKKHIYGYWVKRLKM